MTQRQSSIRFKHPLCCQKSFSKKFWSIFVLVDMGLLLKLNSACEKLIIIIKTSISNALNKFHKGACCDMNTMAYKRFQHLPDHEAQQVEHSRILVQRCLRKLMFKGDAKMNNYFFWIPIILFSFFSKAFSCNTFTKIHCKFLSVLLAGTWINQWTGVTRWKRLCYICWVTS